MTVRVITGAAALGLGMLITGCNKAAPADTSPAKEPAVAETPASPPGGLTLANAAIYACEGGGELAVAFNYGAEQTVTVSANGGVPVTLSPKEDATEPTYTDGASTLSIDVDGVIWNDGAGEKTCKGVSRDIPPPVAPNVVRNLTEADAGAAIDLKVGERFSISLSDVPTAGYAWSPETLPPFLTAGDTLQGATTTAQYLPGYAGGNHWTVLVFEATSAGSADLELAQRRPWEDKADPDDKRYKIKVTVK
jgi:predicted secreted protein